MALRVMVAVIAGVVLWGVLWNLATLGAQYAFPVIYMPGEPIEHTGGLLAFIGVSVVLSILSGHVSSYIAGLRAVWMLALALLVIGFVVELSYWDLMPLWYHVSFLLLIVPATLLGGRLRRRLKRPTPRF